MGDREISTRSAGYNLIFIAACRSSEQHPLWLVTMNGNLCHQIDSAVSGTWIYVYSRLFISIFNLQLIRMASCINQFHCPQFILETISTFDKVEFVKSLGKLETITPKVRKQITYKNYFGKVLHGFMFAENFRRKRNVNEKIMTTKIIIALMLRSTLVSSVRL